MYCGSSEELVAVDLPGAFHVAIYFGGKHYQQLCEAGKTGCDRKHCGCRKPEQKPVFTTQLLELGIPVVVALNKSDIAEKKGTKIDIKLLSERLGCPVIPTVSVSAGHKGLGEVIQTAVSLRQRAESTLCAGRY